MQTVVDILEFMTEEMAGLKDERVSRSLTDYFDVHMMVTLIDVYFCVGPHRIGLLEGLKERQG